MGLSPFLILWYVWLSSVSPRPSTAATVSDRLTQNQVLEDGQTLVSSGQRFELGFFNRGNSSRRYLGIWYKNITLTVVWVANRNKYISGQSGSLSVGSNGFSLLLNKSEKIWSVNATRVLQSPILQLLDNGNLVLKEENNPDLEGYVWQSFDNITDTLLPGMKLGWNLKTGLYRNMTSWLSAEDPSAGDYTFSLDSPETPQLVLSKGTQKKYRWGPWDGVRFSGSNELRSNPVFIPMFNSSREEVYYTFEVIDQESTLSRFVVTQDGWIQYLTWSKSSNEWVTMVTLQRDSCDRYGTCGPYGNCYSDGPKCNCLKGFTPKSPEDWSRIIWSGGCVRRWELECENGDGFVKYGGMKLPDHSHLVESRNLSLEVCEAECLRNCSCMAFTLIDIHGNGGDCVMWFGDLVDMKHFPSGGDDLYIRMAKNELESIADARRNKRVRMIVTVVICVATGMLLCGVASWCAFRIRKAKRRAASLNHPHRYLMEETQEEDLELPLFNLKTVSAATDEFSFRNKIGQGGFGPVYKGVLPSKQEIAVKRLSRDLGQGLREFKNEVILVSKLQHRNLVKLLGCCIHGDERMLIYEYLPNKSLDYFLFDQTRKKLLAWKKRFGIILGIARGILYLHQDSRLRIIHRDLKASNILLDSEMNPKISDFGLARIFGADQTQEMTKRVMGTYGYMSPEYAMSGHFSVKSDVFSFGVLVLEVISGKKNWGFWHPDHDLNLIGHAWKLWIKGNPLELMDALMDDSYSVDELVRYIQVGLLCVQQRVEDRPTMSSVLLMLANEIAMVPQPKEPGFYTEVFSMGMDTSSSGKSCHTTTNEFSTQELN
ncbi:G-type lectin S-receptor-like serine/threonine-protein kinase At4g27290 isoform X2 [Juglans microcarpa x Juglans regia]|uniref:G-type lectin S-receptor-like serine/threonine-protein kinase At4g27290 isoform X2 n=1 Tax=Juglans microcarpa x Juglans regia TaxID=2249226 RepID=UPI001B7E501F|nr:G-type lectin S-receptor-like serine/threonine-protein kinase At4g27290 isoform X2 [Juglans microcarpa x Juglans regia]